MVEHCSLPSTTPQIQRGAWTAVAGSSQNFQVQENKIDSGFEEGERRAPTPRGGGRKLFILQLLILQQQPATLSQAHQGAEAHRSGQHALGRALHRGHLPPPHLPCAPLESMHAHMALGRDTEPHSQARGQKDPSVLHCLNGEKPPRPCPEKQGSPLERKQKGDSFGGNPTREKQPQVRGCISKMHTQTLILPLTQRH